ncbi:transmembrane and coiled-coil domain-containing protein 5B-like [Bubalus kerabau]|uniref:transmembrane and coiled-coil domain-containing protein 5B-like n=1 Tax=Bubalus carabanensis TaxID=3119969 RepID=UPI00244EB1B0|nr:transmembrane and coiled-coil domain-containing protein 5B-like [Bubalus carabanensis]
MRYPKSKVRSCSYTSLECGQRRRSSIQSAKTRPGADCGSDHELLIAKFRLKLKKVGKTIGPLRTCVSRMTVEVCRTWRVGVQQ